MSFWSSETVKDRVPAEGLIQPFDPARVMRGAYELSVGGEAYITSGTGQNTKLGPDERIVIPAGQFGLLVTKETVRVPDDAIAFLSIKATTKLQGLVNVSGFHVDPGYDNTLKFAVYNAGPQRIYVDQNQAVFLIWYASLDRPTADLYQPRPGTSRSITAEDVKRIAGNVASPAELKDQLDQLKSAYDKRLHELETDTEKRIHRLEVDAEQRMRAFELGTDNRVHGIENRLTIVQTLLGALIVLLISSSVGIIISWAKPAPTAPVAPVTHPAKPTSSASDVQPINADSESAHGADIRPQPTDKGGGDEAVPHDAKDERTPEDTDRDKPQANDES